MRKLLAFITLVMFGTLSASGIAYADEKCLVTPEKVVTTHHDAVTHQEYRWTQQVPAVEEVSHVEYRFFRDIPGASEVNHPEYQFSRDVPAIEKVSHLEYRYTRTNPGSDAVTHTEYQFKRTNPGKEETFHKEFKYKKVIPAVDGVKECKYKKSVDDFKTQYHFAKYTQTREGKKVNGKIEWGPYNDWTKWSPETHTSWEDSNDPIGSPQLHAEWTEGNGQYKVYFERVWQARFDGQTRQVKSGSHWEYEWFTSDPGKPWAKTDDCRWKVEPKPEQTVWYKDGAWTTDTPGDPWVKADERSVGNNDAVAPFTEYKTKSGASADQSDAAWFEQDSFSGWTQFNSKTVTDKEAVSPFQEWATKTGRTTDVDKADYFTEAEAATFDRGWSKYGEPIEVIDQEYVPGYTEYKTLDGTSKLLADAAWFTESAFEGWTQFNSRVVIDTPAVPGYREYKTTEGTTLVLEEASWFKQSSFESWTQLDSKKVIDSEFIPGYPIYFLEGRKPTLDLTDANWTAINPGEPWQFVDERTVTDKAAYDTKKTIPAVYGSCVDEDDGDGLRAVADPTPLIGLGVLAALGITGAVIAIRRRRDAA